MNLRSKRIIIGSQIFILIAFLGGMWLNYIFLSPFIYEGEDARFSAKVDTFRSLFDPGKGFDCHNIEQIDSILALDKNPFGGDIILLDADSRIVYSDSGSQENGYEYINKKYGDIASELLKEEYQTKDNNKVTAYSKQTKTNFYAYYYSNYGLMFFYSVEYAISASDLMQKLRLLFLFMIVFGLVLLVIAFFIVNINTFHVQRETQAQQELDTAAAIQKAMLPRGNKHMMQIDLDARLIPAKKVSGDFFCYFLREGLLYFCIGDVSGKGVPASLSMGRAVTLFRGYASAGMTPVAIASAINKELCINNDQNMFLTGILGTISTTTGVIRYVNAGHEPPLIWSGDNDSSIKFLQSIGNIPLGVMPDMEFLEETYEIGPNGMFLMYTDGVSEAKSNKNGFIGRNSVLDIVEPCKTLSSMEINDKIIQYIKDFEHDTEQSDDITLLTFRNTATPKKMTIKNNIQDLKKIASFTEDVFNECPMDSKQRILLRSGLDEALTNCVLYAYDTPGNNINVTASIDDDRLCFTIQDYGVPFNPLEHKTRPIEELQVGGLGISIYRTNFDDVNYCRKDGSNILKLIKKL